MNEKLKDYLNSGRAKLEDENRRNEAIIKADLEHHAKLQEQRRSGILSLVPDFLHQYTSVENDTAIHIEMPRAARVSAKVRLHEDYLGVDGREYFEKASLSTWRTDASSDIWCVSRCGAYDGEVGWFEVDTFDALDVALAQAVELGDGKAEAEQEAARQRAEFAEWDAPDDSVDEAPMEVICPLMSTAQKRSPCLEHGCAWFIAWKGMDACALKVLAHGAADGLEVE